MTAKLGTSTAKFRIGYGAPESVRLGSGAAWEPSGAATFTTTQSSGLVSLWVATSTGYAKVFWWDSTSTVVGVGDDIYQIPATKAAGGAGSKTIRVIPCNVSGTQTGELQFLGFGFTTQDYASPAYVAELSAQLDSITSIDVSECKGLGGGSSGGFSPVYLDSGIPLCAGNPTVKIGNLPLLYTAVYGGNISCDLESLPGANAVDALRQPSGEFVVPELPRPMTFSLKWSSSTSFVADGNANLVSVGFEGCLALSSATIRNCPNVSGVTCMGSNVDNLSSVVLDNLPACSQVFLVQCHLTSIRCTNIELSYGDNHYGNPQNGTWLTNNDLSAAALNQFFTDLLPTTTGILLIRGNPGSLTCDTSIATNKGYIVVTT